MIPVYDFQKPRAHDYPSGLNNFQYFPTPSILPEGHIYLQKAFSAFILNGDSINTSGKEVF